MAGHGRVNTKYPPSFAFTGCPCSLKISAPTPGKGWVAEPGFSVVRAGRGVMRIIPVSVCHQVSTTGHRPPPIYWWYQIQASGLIGSPTVPSSRGDERARLAGTRGPHSTKVRKAVGAV